MTDSVVQCSKCGKSIRHSPLHAGKTFPCPNCQAPLTIPPLAPPHAAAPPQPPPLHDSVIAADGNKPNEQRRFAATAILVGVPLSIALSLVALSLVLVGSRRSRQDDVQGAEAVQTELDGLKTKLLAMAKQVAMLTEMREQDAELLQTRQLKIINQKGSMVARIATTEDGRAVFVIGGTGTGGIAMLLEPNGLSIAKGGKRLVYLRADGEDTSSGTISVYGSRPAFSATDNKTSVVIGVGPEIGAGLLVAEGETMRVQAGVNAKGLAGVVSFDERGNLQLP